MRPDRDRAAYGSHCRGEVSFQFHPVNFKASKVSLFGALKLYRIGRELGDQGCRDVVGRNASEDGWG